MSGLLHGHWDLNPAPHNGTARSLNCWAIASATWFCFSYTVYQLRDNFEQFCFQGWLFSVCAVSWCRIVAGDTCMCCDVFVNHCGFYSEESSLYIFSCNLTSDCIRSYTTLGTPELFCLQFLCYIAPLLFHPSILCFYVLIYPLMSCQWSLDFFYGF